MKHAVLAVGLLVAASANAAVVYDNGTPNGANGNEATAWIQTEDFTLGAATTLTGATVYLGGTGNGFPAGWDGNVRWYVFADGGTTPGAQLFSGIQSPTAVDTGQAWNPGGNIFSVSLNLGSINLAAGDYYFGIHTGADGNFDRDEVYWVTTNANATPTGVESFGGTQANWSNNGQEHAFNLIGEGGGGVPEPATWAMMIMGFGLVGSTLRRRAVAQA